MAGEEEEKKVYELFIKTGNLKSIVILKLNYYIVKIALPDFRFQKKQMIKLTFGIGRLLDLGAQRKTIKLQLSTDFWSQEKTSSKEWQDLW